MTTHLIGKFNTHHVFDQHREIDYKNSVIRPFLFGIMDKIVWINSSYCRCGKKKNDAIHRQPSHASWNSISNQ